VGDLLEQSEVDALLAALETGNLTPAEAAAPPRRGEKEVGSYDFKRPERVSKEQMRALSAVQDSFSRSFGAALSGFLRTIVEVRVVNIEQLTYSEFIQSLPNPTCFNLLHASSLEGQMCLEISPLIIYPVIDRLLGGSTAEMFIPQRPLTAIELRLIKRIIDRALTSLAEAWSNVCETTFMLDSTESNPQLAQIVPPNEVAVVVSFELKMGGRAGTMSLCIPFNVIEPVMHQLSKQNWLSYRRKNSDADSAQRIAQRISGAPVQVRAFLAETNITVSDLANLAVGDIITTERVASAEIILQVEGRNKFAARMGEHKGHKAIKITRDLSPGQRV
jgi:flagellar motor switch protein FliM